MSLYSIPKQFRKYIDNDYSFTIINSIPTIEIELNNEKYSVAKFFHNKSYTLSNKNNLIVPESIFFEILLKQGHVRVLITKEKFFNLFIAGQLFEESNLTGPRIQKYLTLFRAYESLTMQNERDLLLSSIRHSLSHSVTNLTHTLVTKTLFDLFGGLEIDLSQFRHKKVFYIYYWQLLKEVDKLICQNIEKLLPNAKDLVMDLKIIC